MKVIAFITDYAAVDRIIDHRGATRPAEPLDVDVPIQPSRGSINRGSKRFKESSKVPV
jgi:hypothetical protein